MIRLLTSITSFLAGEGFGTVGTDLFSGALPSHPQKCTAVMQSGGPGKTGDPTKSPALTILHRDRSLQNATTFVTSLNALMLANNGFRCLPGDFHGRLESLAEPGIAGHDDRNLIVYQVQYTFVTTNQL